jgi:hypothetical protein
MKILDLLRKLGVLRSGAETGAYTSAADRPASFAIDGVLDSKKDLVTRQDLSAARDRLRGDGQS